MIENSRKSNFNIGLKNRNDNVASQNTDTYKPQSDTGKKNGSHEISRSIKDNKAANFRFGSTNTRYVTTNNEIFNDQQVRNGMKDYNPKEQEQEKKDRQLKNRMQ